MSEPDPTDPTWITFITPNTDHETAVLRWLEQHAGRQVRLELNVETPPDPHIPGSTQYRQGVLSVSGLLIYYQPSAAIGDLTLDPELARHASQVVSSPLRIHFHVASGATLAITDLESEQGSHEQQTQQG